MSQLGLLPLSLVLLLMITFGVSYIIAVARGDVRPVFPYISDTGARHPESCVFGQLLNVAAFMALCTMYVRYKAIEAMAHTTLNDNSRIFWLNKCSLVTGVLSALGISIVANFQEGTDVKTVHFTGASVAFSVGILYCFLQTALSYQMYPDYNGVYICRIRLSLSLAALSAFITTVVSAVFAFHEKDSTETDFNRFLWSPGEPGFAAHIVSSSGEWITALMFISFFATYIQEFNKFEMEFRTRPLVQHLDDIAESRVGIQVNERTGLLA